MSAGPANPRARRRRILQLIGLPPLVLAVAFFAKVVTMEHHDTAGQEAWDERNGAVALEHYAANRSVNLLQRWLAPFDDGDAAFLLTDYGRAVRSYTEALDSVPHEQECTVRINLSLAEEKIGDAAAKAGHSAAAAQAWKAGVTALDAGHCPTDSGQGERQSKNAATLKQRLQDKLRTPPSAQRRQGQQQSPAPSPQERDKLKKLQRHNDQGRSDRNRSQDERDYDNFSDQYEW